MAKRGLTGLSSLLITAFVVILIIAVLVIAAYYLNEKVVPDLGLSSNATADVQSITTKMVSVGKTTAALIILPILVFVFMYVIAYLKRVE